MSVNYAYPFKQTFSTSKPVKRATKLTPSMKNQRAFAKAHKVSIQVNSKTGEVSAKVTAR